MRVQNGHAHDILESIFWYVILVHMQSPTYVSPVFTVPFTDIPTTVSEIVEMRRRFRTLVGGSSECIVIHLEQVDHNSLEMPPVEVIQYASSCITGMHDDMRHRVVGIVVQVHRVEWFVRTALDIFNAYLCNDDRQIHVVEGGECARATIRDLVRMHGTTRQSA